MTYAMIDTETTGTIEAPIAYDIGWAIVSDNGEVLHTRSCVVEEVFMDLDKMSTAYFADKRSLYWDGIMDGSRKMYKFAFIRHLFLSDCKRFAVDAIVAHNAPFDVRSTRNTARAYSEYRYFLPYGIPVFDTLKMARETINHDEEYTKFCEDNGFLCKNGKNRLTAEIIYRFLINDLSFEESHTGLEDVLIEKVILMECLRRMDMHD